MSDEGREGGAGEGGAERRAPPLVRASLNFLPAMRACGGKYPVLYVVVCVGRAHGEWFMCMCYSTNFSEGRGFERKCNMCAKVNMGGHVSQLGGTNCSLHVVKC